MGVYSSSLLGLTAICPGKWGTTQHCFTAFDWGCQLRPLLGSAATREQGRNRRLPHSSVLLGELSSSWAFLALWEEGILMVKGLPCITLLSLLLGGGGDSARVRALLDHHLVLLGGAQ